MTKTRLDALRAAAIGGWLPKSRAAKGMGYRLAGEGLMRQSGDNRPYAITQAGLDVLAANPSGTICAKLTLRRPGGVTGAQPIGCTLPINHVGDCCSVSA